MRIIREASLGDAAAIEKLIKNVLPNDPVILLLEGAKNQLTFFESLILSNRVVVSIENGKLLGMASVGSIFGAFRYFFKNLSFVEISMFLFTSCKFRKLFLIIGTIRIMFQARYFPSKNEISWLAVNPLYQGKGIGKSIVESVASRFLLPNEHLIAKTLAKTPENVDFYRSCGMLPVKEKGGRVILIGSREKICIALSKPNR